MPPSTTPDLDATVQRMRALGKEQAAIRDEKRKLVADARQVERGLLALIKKALDAGQLDADDATSMLPMVRRLIEGNTP